MSWANFYVKKLREGKIVKFRPKGNSMKGKINNGDLVTVKPVEGLLIIKSDIVLCKVNGRYYLHLVTATKNENNKVLYQISNNKGHVNGWITRNNIYGRCIQIEKGK